MFLVDSVLLMGAITLTVPAADPAFKLLIFSWFSADKLKNPATLLLKFPTPLYFNFHNITLFSSGQFRWVFPVAIISPGQRVIIFDRNETIVLTGKIRSLVFPDCFFSPFKNVSIFTLQGLISVSMKGPMGAKESKPFALVNCTSFFWRSRAVTSLKQVYPRTYFSESSSVTNLHFFPYNNCQFTFIINLG